MKSTGSRPLRGAIYKVYQIRDGTLQVPQEDAYPPNHHVHASQPTHLTEVQESGRITDNSENQNGPERL